MNQSPCYTISEATEEYLAIRGIDKIKYFSKYLICAKNAYKKVYQTAMYTTRSEWMPLKKGDPYNYIDVPANMNRLFAVLDVDECGNFVPLYYNNKLNVIKRPTVKACGCDACDCSGLCEDLNAMTMVTKEMFTVNGITYYQKTWYKYCPNGDILEYTETPTKKYNDFVGQSGDYANDYMNDYSIGNPGFSNFEIVTVTAQRKICALTVRPCGCPEDTEENAILAQQVCGCAWPFGTFRKKHCDRFLGDINNNCRGQVKLSECQTKIYYVPMPHSRLHNGTTHIPDYLNVSFQSNGLNPDGSTLVADYALDAIWSGTDYFYKRFNNTFSLNEKSESKRAFESEINNVILFLNPINLEVLSNIQDAPTRW